MFYLWTLLDIAFDAFGSLLKPLSQLTLTLGGLGHLWSGRQRLSGNFVTSTPTRDSIRKHTSCARAYMYLQRFSEILVNSYGDFGNPCTSPCRSLVGPRRVLMGFAQVLAAGTYMKLHEHILTQTHPEMRTQLYLCLDWISIHMNLHEYPS